MIKQPLVLTDGQLEQLQNGYELPNQPEIDRLYLLLGSLVFELMGMGIELQNEELIELIKLKH